MVDKYIYKTIKVSGHFKYVAYKNPNIHTIHKFIQSYERKQRFINPEYMAIEFGKKYNKEFSNSGKYKDLLANQVLHQDWSHMSEQYPNIIGLTDIEINQFLSNPNNWNEYLYSPKNIDYVKDYLSRIKCYNQDTLMRISSNMHDEWRKRMKKWNKDNQEYILESNKFGSGSTIFVTSAKGGLEILSNFAYANSNDIKKRNIPYDWQNGVYTERLSTSSLPYSYENISDVNDIVYLDDIFMSGEQFGSAKVSIANKLQELNISKEQMPRIHYMAIAGNMDKAHLGTTYYSGENINNKEFTNNGKEWHTITIGDKLSFDRQTHYPYTSACIFPYSIPDGDHHKIARILYSKYHKFTHRSVG